MQKITLFVLFFIGGIAFPAALFAGGGADMVYPDVVYLRIENRTGLDAQEIIITNTETRAVNRTSIDLARNASTAIKVERAMPYSVVLVNVDGFRNEVEARRFYHNFNSIVVDRTNFAPVILRRHRDDYSTHGGSRTWLNLCKTCGITHFR